MKESNNTLADEADQHDKHEGNVDNVRCEDKVNLELADDKMQVKYIGGVEKLVRDKRSEARERSGDEVEIDVEGISDGRKEPKMRR